MKMADVEVGMEVYISAPSHLPWPKATVVGKRPPRRVVIRRAKDDAVMEVSLARIHRGLP